MKKYKVILFLIFISIIFNLFIFSTETYRLKLINYAIKNNNHVRALELYRKVLRKREIWDKSKSFLVKNIKKDFYGSDDKIKYFCAQIIKNDFDKAITCYSERDFNNALKYYDCAMFNLSLLLPYLKNEILKLTGITEQEVQLQDENRIYKLAILALKSGDKNFVALKGVNLLPNARLIDGDNNGCPDNYIFSIRQEDNIIKSEVLPDLGSDANIYHIKKGNTEDEFMLYFKPGRVPNGTIFTFSVESKSINEKNYLNGSIFTYTDKCGAWNSGEDRIKINSCELLENGWNRCLTTLKTIDNEIIFLEGWLAAWPSLKGGGDIYVRRPKLEIGADMTEWTDYLTSIQ